MYRMLTVNRSRLGRWRYYEHALRLFLTKSFPTFIVQVHNEDGSWSTHKAVSVMALRVGNLQGVFSGVARGAALAEPSLHVVLVAPPARLALPLWLGLSWCGLLRWHRGVTLRKATVVEIADRVPLQIDGEWAGHSSAKISLDGPSQRVLVPVKA